MKYSPNTKIWVASANAPISDEMLKRLDILVHPNNRSLQKRMAYEVLVFVTEQEWESCMEEKELKKRITAKFRSYDDAEQYAQKLLIQHTYYHKVVLRS